MPKKITICYRNRETKCPVCTQVFTGKDCDILAANYQSAHPELEEISCNIVR